MKLAYTVATPETADSGMFAMHGSIEQNFETLGRLGYDGAELMVRDVSQLKASAIKAAAAAHHLEIKAISTGQLHKEDHLSLNDADRDRRKLAVSRTKAVVDFAAELGAQVNIGNLRGHLPAAGSRQESVDRARESISQIAEHAASNRVIVALEPQCRFLINWLNSVAETIEFIRSVNAKNVKMLFNIYHAGMEEPSVFASMIVARDRISGVQLSDSNRRAPGAGHVHFGEILRVLDALGYQGYLSVECLPMPDAATAAEIAIRHLRPLMPRPPKRKQT
jgi:sugar phosphate isomerase/epimerase